MAHLAHTPLRRRLKGLLLAFGFALFVVMAILTAHQASDPKLSRGRHTIATPSASQSVPAAAASTSASARSLAAVEPTPSPASASSSPPATPTDGTVTPSQPATSNDGQSAALAQTLSLSANLRAAMNQPPATAAGQQ